MKLIIIVSLLLSAGCATSKLAKNRPEVPLDIRIIEHESHGATSYETLLETVKSGEFRYLAREKFQISTNYYQSNGEVLPFIEINRK